MNEEFTDGNNDRSKINSDLTARSSVEDRDAALKNVRDELQFLETNQAMALKQGSLSADQICLQGVFALAVGCSAGSDPEAKRKAEQEWNDYLMLVVLDEMHQRLKDLDAAMEESRFKLVAKYGDDYVGGMVDTLLTDEEKSALKTEDDKMRALASKMLNPDRTIKAPYKDSEEAKYVRDWQEAQTLRPIIQKYEGRNQLTAEEEQEVYRAAQTSSLAASKNMIALSTNEEFKSTVDKSLDNERVSQEKSFQAIPLIVT